MKRNYWSFLLIVLLVLLGRVLGADKIAICDFDDRSKESNPNAKLIEKELLKIDKSYVVEQFNAGSDDKKAIEILSQIDRGGYKLLIVITTDALKVASHFVKNTPYLFTNVNNPVFVGVTDLKNPGNNRSGVSYYVPVGKHFALMNQIKPGLKK